MSTTVSIKIDDVFEGKDFITSFSGDGTLYETRRFRDLNRELVYNHYIPRLLEYIIPNPYEVLDNADISGSDLGAELQLPEDVDIIAPKNVDNLFWRRMCDRVFELDILRSSGKKNMNNSFLMRFMLFVIYDQRTPDLTISQLKKIDALAGEDPKLRSVVARAVRRNIFKASNVFHRSFKKIITNISASLAYNYVSNVYEIFNYGNPYGGYYCDGVIMWRGVVDTYTYGRYLQDMYIDYAITGQSNKYNCVNTIERMMLISFCILHPHIDKRKGINISLLFRLYTEEFIPHRKEFDKKVSNILEAFLGIYFVLMGGDYKKYFIDNCEEESYTILADCGSTKSAFESFERLKGWDDHYVSIANKG